MLYGNYDAQPELGYLQRREGILGTASFKVAQNWVVSGGARYDLINDKINQYIIGAGYVDDCFIFALNYITDYAYVTATSLTPVTDHRVMLQIGLRTIGGTNFSQSAGTTQ